MTEQGSSSLRETPKETDMSNNDAISALNNCLQALGREAGLSWVDHQRGPEHSPEWTSQCKLDGVVIGTGQGPQKNLAREAAARLALAALSSVDQ